VAKHSTGDAVVLCGEFEKREPDGIERDTALHVLRKTLKVGTVKKNPF
jgi:hypothetical protein